jgi:hypothetical protein
VKLLFAAISMIMFIFGAGSREQGAESREQGEGRRDKRAGSREQGAGQAHTLEYHHENNRNKVACESISLFCIEVCVLPPGYHAIIADRNIPIQISIIAYPHIAQVESHGSDDISKLWAT